MRVFNSILGSFQAGCFGGPGEVEGLSYDYSLRDEGGVTGRYAV